MDASDVKIGRRYLLDHVVSSSAMTPPSSWTNARRPATDPRIFGEVRVQTARPDGTFEVTVLVGEWARWSVVIDAKMIRWPMSVERKRRETLSALVRDVAAQLNGSSWAKPVVDRYELHLSGEALERIGALLAADTQRPADTSDLEDLLS